MHRFPGISFLVAICCASAAAPAWADDDPGYPPGPWHYKAISCVVTTVKSVFPRLGEPGQTHFPPSQFKETGVEVTFNTGLGIQPLFTSGLAEVVHYQGVAGNDVMAAEHPGDRVQVCYLDGPAPTKYCNPDTDGRGRDYRVYDYRRKQQYWGMNSEHGCGGA